MLGIPLLWILFSTGLEPSRPDSLAGEGGLLEGRRSAGESPAGSLAKAALPQGERAGLPIPSEKPAVGAKKKEPWWKNPNVLETVRLDYGKYLEAAREYYIHGRVKGLPIAQKKLLDRFGETGFPKTATMKQLRYEDFSDQTFDRATYVANLLTDQSLHAYLLDSPDPKRFPLEKLEENPLAFPPELFFQSYASQGAWKKDASLARDVAGLETTVLRKWSELQGEQAVLQSAIYKSIKELGLSGIPPDLGLVSPAWARLEEAEKRLQTEFLAGIRDALAVRGL
ncbi:MAG: hypothetical protein ACE5H3_04270, partial [Planctomycetota bacterium]